MRISGWSSDVCSSDLWVAARRTDRFVLDTWARQAFVAETLAWPRFGAAAEGKLRCDPLGCLYEREGLPRAAILLDPSAADDDCGRAAVVIRVEPLRRQPCAGAARAEERSVGTECVSPCRSRWWSSYYKQKYIHIQNTSY